MAYLVGVTVLWAFSYSLIGVYLSGQVDSYFAVFTRITLALLVFAPFTRVRGIPWNVPPALMAVGALELGLMYIFFYQSFLWLSVPEVLLFTIFTPVYVTLIEDCLAGRFSPYYLITAIGAVAGAAIIRYRGVGGDYWIGFALVQGANLCFAGGQIAYRRVAKRLPANIATPALFGWFFAGAWPVALVTCLCFGDLTALPTTGVQWGILLWLGVGASGIGYCAWNMGAVRVDPGTLAVMNNVLIPAGLLVNLLIWNHHADLPRLTAGAAIIGASLIFNRVWTGQRTRSLDAT